LGMVDIGIYNRHYGRRNYAVCQGQKKGVRNMKEKLYFEECSEGYCYPLHYFKDRIEDGEEKIELQLAKRDIGKGCFWCIEAGEALETSEGSCGSICADYKPRNGKSGICVNHRNTFSTTGKILVLTKDGLTIKEVL